MKKSIFAFAALALAFSTASAQVDRSKAPKPSAAPEIKIKDAETFKLENGLTVVLVENHKRPTVSFQLDIDYVPFLEGDKAGNSSLAGQLLSTGTTTKSKEQIDEALDFVGASLNTNSRGFFASTLTKHKDVVLGLASDILLNPSFSQVELDKIKKQTISGLKSNKVDASAIAANVSNVLRYGSDHPYGEIETEESVEAITSESIKEFYTTYFRPNISYLVIVGDVNRKEAEALSKKYFGAWKKADVPVATLPKVEAPEGTQVVFVPREGAVQSVINVTYPVDLKVGSEDAIKASVMNNILGGGIFSGRLMQNLREDKGYTYGARSALRSDENIGYFTANANVRNEVTDSSVTQFMLELNRLRDEPVEASDLSLTLNSMNGAFARGLESSQSIASFALNTIKYNLPKDYYKNYLAKLSAVSVADIQEMAAKYILPNNAYIFVVGSMDVAESLKAFDTDGNITFLNYKGEVEEPNTMQDAPEGVTAEKVYDDYVLAFTATTDMKSALKKIKKLKDVTTKGKASVGPAELDINTFKKAPNMYAMSVLYGGAEVQKQKFNGTSGKSINMQTGASDLEGDELEAMKIQAQFIPEMSYATMGYTSTVLGVDKVNGSDAYVIEVTSPKGDKSKVYFDVNNHLKVKNVSTGEAPTGESFTSITEFKNYKNHDGYLFPMTTEISGAQDLTIEVKEVLVNSKLSSDIFN